MIDDAQASIAALKTQLSAAQAEASESARALRHAEEDLSEHEAEEQRQHQSLRCAPCYNSLLYCVPINASLVHLYWNNRNSRDV